MRKQLLIFAPIHRLKIALRLRFRAEKTHLKTDLNATSEISCPTVLVTKRFHWLLPKIIQVFVDNNFVVNDFDLATV